MFYILYIIKWTQIDTDTQPGWSPACCPAPVPPGLMMGCWVCFGLMPCDAAAAEGGLALPMRAAHGSGDPLWGCLFPGALPFNPQHGWTSSLLLDPSGTLHPHSPPGPAVGCSKDSPRLSPKSPCRVWGRNKDVQNDPTRTWTTGSHMCKQTKVLLLL